MKHQKELIEKYKKKYLQFYPYPMFTIVTNIDTDEEKLYLIDFMSYMYYYIFLFFRYKFPIVAYQTDSYLYDYRQKIQDEYHQTKVDKHPKLNKFATRISPIAGVLGMFIHQLFPDIIDPIILPLLSIPTPHGYVYTMMVLFVVTLFVLYGIIKRNNELKQALKKDGVRKYKLKVIRKIKKTNKEKMIVIGLYVAAYFLSTLIFKLPKDMFSTLLSIPLSFLSAYIWWYVLYLPYVDVEEVEILEELNY